jgi:hypothetical protein
MPSTELLSELRGLLVQGNEVSDRLLDRLDDSPDPVEIVSLLESLSVTEERRAHVLDQLRKEASSLRKREEERSIRQFVLRALDRIGTPQTTGFLEDYLYATELVEAKSRGMGALRRDEYRAWARLRKTPRVAYITPCLDEEGSAVARWMSRSDWPLARRVMVRDAEELWAAQRVLALADGYRAADADGEALFLPLIARYAHETIGDGLEPGEDDRWVADVVHAARARQSELEPRVTKAQERVARRMMEAGEVRRFWGI